MGEFNAITALHWIPTGKFSLQPTRVVPDGDAIAEMKAQYDAERKKTRGGGGEGSAMDVDGSGGAGGNDDGLLAEFDFGSSDDEEREPFFAAGMNGNLYYTSNKDDPYLTIPDEMDSLDGLELKPSDALLLVARSTNEISYVDTWVMEEDADHAYVHHDVLLDAQPLCVAWNDFNPATQERDGSIFAVGAMIPQIEIFDVNLVDALDPNVVLGGPVAPGSHELLPGSHEAGVLSLDWNPELGHLLASASADHTVKCWDVNTQTCVHTFSHHSGVVSGVAWNHIETPLMLTCAYDHHVSIVDARTQRGVSCGVVPTDPDCLVWDPFTAHLAYAGCDDGNVYVFDARNPNAEPLYVLDAHAAPLRACVFNPAIPGMFVTAGEDKTFSVWDVSADAPQLVYTSKRPKVGKIFTAEFLPSSPSVIALGGDKGVVSMIDLASSGDIHYAFGERFQAAGVVPTGSSCGIQGLHVRTGIDGHGAFFDDDLSSSSDDDDDDDDADDDSDQEQGGSRRRNAHKEVKKQVRRARKGKKPKRSS